MAIPIEEVEQAARAVISHKGYPYSQTEFNCVYYNVLADLQKKGATKEQLQKFEQLVNNAPIRGGHFNSYSGD